jgi:hypothetical protein
LNLSGAVRLAGTLAGAMSDVGFSIPCCACAHDLMGPDSTGHCPSCGETVSQTLHYCAVNPFDLTVERDLSCVHCGYNLRAQRAAGPCPACGRPVQDALSVGPFHVVNVEWLHRLQVGSWLLGTSLLGLVVCLPAGYLLAREFLNQKESVWSFTIIVDVGAILLFLTMAWAGLFIMALPDPHPLAHQEGRAMIYAYRAFVALVPITVLLAVLLAPITSDDTVGLLLVALPLLAAGALFCSVTRMRQILMRAHRDGWCRLATIVGILIAGGAILAPTYVLLSNARRGRGNATGLAAELASLCGPVLLALVLISIAGLIVVSHGFSRMWDHLMAQRRGT